MLIAILIPDSSPVISPSLLYFSSSFLTTFLSHIFIFLLSYLLIHSLFTHLSSHISFLLSYIFAYFLNSNMSSYRLAANLYSYFLNFTFLPLFDHSFLFTLLLFQIVLSHRLFLPSSHAIYLFSYFLSSYFSSHCLMFSLISSSSLTGIETHGIVLHKYTCIRVLLTVLSPMLVYYLFRNDVCLLM